MVAMRILKRHSMAMTRFLPDRFLLMILAAMALAWAVPAYGNALSLLQDIIGAGIFTLFFLHGLRLPRREVVKAARGWRLQLAMLGFSFAALPLAGWAIAGAAGSALPPLLIAGLIYTAILPSTVQSAVSNTSLAGGNVAASVVGAALSNLTGLLATPLLAAWLLHRTGGLAMEAGLAGKIAVMLLLPFALGQLAQHWLGKWAHRQKALLALFDRSVILLAVYIAFAGAIASGALDALDAQAWLALSLALGLMLAFAFGGALMLGGAMGLPRADRISLLFAGAHKSIATGAPMAAILFGSEAGLIILPTILYHMAQLLLSAPIATRFGRHRYDTAQTG